ncbi:MAG: L-threonylcarbamoyladenylate synthase [bacterium]|nr:L-threonylcarbamoyladenylate synthase [bacterium]
MTKIVKISETPLPEIVKTATETLRNGGLVVFPTETLYGIGADATNQVAIDKLLAYKTRREGKPLSIAVNGQEMAEQYVEVNKVAENLYTNFLPGPLTVISKSKGNVAKGVESETGTLGVRIPDYPLVLDIINALGKPITATSANASYKKRPYAIEDILNNISNKQKDLIDLIIDAGELPKREPSTVVDTTLNQEVILRQGDIKLTKVLEQVSNSPEETQALGIKILKKYQHYLGYKSVIFAMQGELGAGKTEMTKGIARVLGVKEVINSPTFIIEKEYNVEAVPDSYLAERKPKFYHMDTWKVYETSEIEDLGFLEQVRGGNVFAIEWADKITPLFEKIAEDSVIIWIKIEHKDENSRLITVSDYTI